MSKPKKFKIGDQVGNWTIIGFYNSKYEVMCKCGKRLLKTASDIEKVKSCRDCTRTLRIHPGDRFGCSVVLKEIPRSKWQRQFLVDCDCGSTHVLGHKALLTRQVCVGKRKAPSSNSVQAELIKRFANAPKDVQNSKAYELWISLRREKDAPLCDNWKEFIPFLIDLAELLGGEPFEYCEPRRQWVYYQLERIDKDGIWEKDNVTARKFYTGRAYHRRTYLYWRLLSKRGLLEPEYVDDYILFINTFGEKQTGYVLRRRDKQRLHSRSNSEWVRTSRAISRDDDSV